MEHQKQTCEIKRRKSKEINMSSLVHTTDPLAYGVCKKKTEKEKENAAVSQCGLGALMDSFWLMDQFM
jgi:ATP-dependent Zn protease